jgi:hypothetical protein
MPHPGSVHADRTAPTPKGAADARDTLRILLTAHYELTEVAADQAQELRALLLRGNGTDRSISRGGLAFNVLGYLTRRVPPPEATDKHVARNEDIRRLAHVLIAYRDELSANRKHMTTLVNELVPGITAQPGMGPFKAAKAILDTDSFALQQPRNPDRSAATRSRPQPGAKHMPAHV